jgi:hypothetical protein
MMTFVIKYDSRLIRFSQFKPASSDKSLAHNISLYIYIVTILVIIDGF